MEIALLLFLVIDPFGNLPFVLAVLKRLDGRAYRRAIARELGLAFLILLGFAVAGEAVLAYFRIDQASLQISGGIILFLISLKMLFQSSKAIFPGEYQADPILVPIAMPAIAGPAAITTLIILRNQQQAALGEIVLALLGVLTLTALVLLAGRRLQRLLGERGIDAMEKLMGLILNMVAVNMVLDGIRLSLG
ncbi:MAG: MarC family protein [Gammaproteobacteria bacterium]|nr:MAG: MarC family protein [Gammaproteobacteria bacterium]